MAAGVKPKGLKPAASEAPVRQSRADRQAARTDDE